MDRGRFHVSLILFSFLAMLLCAVQTRAAELKPITLGYSSIGPMATGFWMAKEIGAFEKHGMHAEIIYISSGPVVIQALIGGDLQGGSAATNAVINAILSGAPDHWCRRNFQSALSSALCAA
jgi:ABC-type nitrate/sulfonate/bicarbonate transport system substrate-binding protein